MNNLKMLEIGTNVKFGMDYEFTGEITAITIRETSDKDRFNIIYELTYWKDAEMKTTWLFEKNFKVIKTQKKGIGFQNEEVA